MNISYPVTPVRVAQRARGDSGIRTNRVVAAALPILYVATYYYSTSRPPTTLYVSTMRCADIASSVSRTHRDVAPGMQASSEKHELRPVRKTGGRGEDDRQGSLSQPL